MLPIRKGIPHTAEATIVGFSRCALTITAFHGRAGTVVFHGSDGGRMGPAANYMALGKLPRGTQRVTATASCRYTRRGKARRINLSSRLDVQRATA
jgi:hypothetical protein